MAMYLILWRRAVRLGLLSMVVAGAVTLAGCSGPARRPVAASPAAAVTSAAVTPSSSRALPPDKDPTKPQYHEAQLGSQIGGPAEFQTFHLAAWDGTRMVINYSFHCYGDGCDDHVIPLIVTWARKAGVPATQFTSRKLYACIHTSCSTSLTRDGFSVALTARVGADNTYVGQPGDVLYVVEVTIRPM